MIIAFMFVLGLVAGVLITLGAIHWVSGSVGPNW